MSDKDSATSITRGMTRRTLMVTGMAAIAFSLAGPAAFAATAPVKVTEKDVSVKTPDGTADAVLFYPTKGKKPLPAILLWPDLAGMRPSIRAWGRDMAAAGYVVLMPNAYYRSAPAATGEVNIGDPEVRKRQMEYRAVATDEGIARDAIAYMAFLDAQKQTSKSTKAGTLGYDVGGSYAFRTAAALPDRIGAVGSVYGLGVATPRPNSPHLLVPKTKAAYYVAVSKDDDTREPDDKSDIKAMIAQGNLQGTVEVYPANHGWATPGSRSADAASAERVTSALLTFFKATL